jgi:hypothetical protein
MRERFERRTVVRGEDEQKSTSRQPKRVCICEGSVSGKKKLNWQTKQHADNKQIRAATTKTSSTHTATTSVCLHKFRHSATTSWPEP